MRSASKKIDRGYLEKTEQLNQVGQNRKKVCFLLLISRLCQQAQLKDVVS